MINFDCLIEAVPQLWRIHHNMNRITPYFSNGEEWLVMSPLSDTIWFLKRLRNNRWLSDQTSGSSPSSSIGAEYMVSQSSPDWFPVPFTKWEMSHVHRYAKHHHSRWNFRRWYCRDAFHFVEGTVWVPEAFISSEVHWDVYSVEPNRFCHRENSAG